MTGPSELRTPVRVMVVDDYRPIADLLASSARHDGHDARVAYSASEAIRLAEEFQPHAVIADAILSDMDGWTLGAEINRRLPGCNVLLMSADIYLHHPPADAPHFRLVPKSMIPEELERLLARQALG